MTDMTQLIERLLGYADSGAGGWRSICEREAADALTQQAARIAELNERLENNRVYRNGERIDVDAGTIPDGIECRDETIALLDERISSKDATIARLRDALQGWQDLHDDMIAQGGDLEELPEGLIEQHAKTQIDLMNKTRKALDQ